MGDLLTIFIFRVSLPGHSVVFMDTLACAEGAANTAIVKELAVCREEGSLVATSRYDEFGDSGEGSVDTGLNVALLDECAEIGRLSLGAG